MSNPLSLLPIALAARSGRVDGVPAPSLVAAGFALLQRSAPLVRALAGRRSAILLPPSGAWLIALAASDGRGAVLLSPGAGRDEIARQLDDADVGAVFTTRALAPLIPAMTGAVVLLDDAPRTALVRTSVFEAPIDLGSHFGLALEGAEEEGSDEECVIVYDSGAPGAAPGIVHPHRTLLGAARGGVDATAMLAGDHLLAMLPLDDLMGVAVTLAAPMLAGARVSSLAVFRADDALRLIEQQAITIVAGTPPMYDAMAQALAARGARLDASALRVCLCDGLPTDPSLDDRWHERTGHELHAAYARADGTFALMTRRADAAPDPRR